MLDIPNELRWYLDFDLYIFVAGRSLLPGNADLPMLKSMGKKIVQFHTGSELHHWSIFKSIWEDRGYTYPSFRSIESTKQISDLRQICESNDPYLQLFANKLYNTRISELFADVLMVQPSYNGFAIRPYYATIIPVDYSRCNRQIQNRIEPIIVHAPSNWSQKGTSRILQVVEDLHRERVRFQFTLMSSVPNQSVLAAMSEADIVLDRLSCGGVPRVGYEAMGSGSCLIGSDERDLVPLPFDRPNIAVRPDTLKEKLREIIVDRQLRTDKIDRALEFINSGFNNPVGAARNILSCLERSQQYDFDYYPFQYLSSASSNILFSIPEFIFELTDRTVRRWGVPDQLNLNSPVRQGLLPRSILEHHLPTWSTVGTQSAAMVFFDKKPGSYSS
ncbi:glycosyltransferase [Magnetovirga frankeli]|uniref:glycosyltransferase n=1 Tax=Magnetovirga frankeli TaxID=947516 RepID=UPI00129300E6|nr:glycosyltransferase [gamma proteobacterium SS-5]